MGEIDYVSQRTLISSSGSVQTESGRGVRRETLNDDGAGS